MNTPTFSIIVPVYNAAETLHATVASVLKQTDLDWELILVDDGSTDLSVRVMMDLTGQDDRIRMVSQNNKGPSAARNLGAVLACGRYLAFLDADDFWTADKLASHRCFHETFQGIDASFARIEFLETDASGKATVRTASTVPAGVLDLPQVIAENPVCTTSNLVISSAAFHELGGFSEQMAHAEDQEFIARFVDQGYLIGGIDTMLVRYNMMESGLSADLGAMLRGWRSLADNYADRIDVDAAEAVYCRYLARRALRTGASPAVALAYIRDGLALDAAAFLADRRRGVMTVLATVASIFMPRPMRRRLFA